ncbi:hypothetical protein BJY04DRAFT_186304 [Aspergillus karnatakaensis]|uniref:uncharacterized protein n=1 Tax=Aspergillus karnatakaensis TaxID=1810916 RepID=UPI003CCD40AB
MREGSVLIPKHLGQYSYLICFFVVSLRCLRFFLSPLFHIRFLNKKNSFRFLSRIFRVFLYYIFGTIGTTSMQNNWVGTAMGMGNRHESIDLGVVMFLVRCNMLNVQ